MRWEQDGNDDLCTSRDEGIQNLKRVSLWRGNEEQEENSIALLFPNHKKENPRGYTSHQTGTELVITDTCTLGDANQ